MPEFDANHASDEELTDETSEEETSNKGRIPEDTVEFIRDLYENHGYGMPRIVRALNEAGIAPVRGRQWYNPVVLQLVKSRGFVKGVYVDPTASAETETVSDTSGEDFIMGITHPELATAESDLLTEA